MLVALSRAFLHRWLGAEIAPSHFSFVQWNPLTQVPNVGNRFQCVELELAVKDGCVPAVSTFCYADSDRGSLAPITAARDGMVSRDGGESYALVPTAAHTTADVSASSFGSLLLRFLLGDTVIAAYGIFASPNQDARKTYDENPC